uniref:RNA helicase n=1 Tax=Trypanosoma cruzi TaxID=5693 RepID=Q9XYP4_TRYCR|nr:putative pre-mRNA splicing factor ATP-dependent RNA helicase [Trypanosoma cruzi]
MDPDKSRKAQQGVPRCISSQAGTQAREAASAVLQEKISEIEAGVLPHSLAEIELLSKRAREVQATGQLQITAQLRQELLEEDGALASHASDHGGDSSLPLNQVELMQQSSSVGYQEKSHNFVAMDESVVDERSRNMTLWRIRQRNRLNRSVQWQYRNNTPSSRARRSLPIYHSREALLEIIRKNTVVIIVGETGSGKTTQLLQYLYEENLCRTPPCLTEGGDGGGKGKEEKEGEEEEGASEEKRFICTQPRRIAAISVAERVAQEMNTRCGSIVGYKVRFDEKLGPTTRLLFVTDGMMLKELVGDPELRTVSAIMVDEAHERSINTDILLGLLKDITRRNKQLKVIVASATINAEKLQFFDGAPIFSIKGTNIPVDVSYLTEPMADYVSATAESVLRDCMPPKPLPGDILVFLPGQEDIENCAAAIVKHSQTSGGQLRPLMVLPIYASLPPREQRRIYEVPPPTTRKVVIATNIAETSITIDGVVYVVDCGLCKQNYYNYQSMVEELRVLPISQASAKQRTGRAGRTQRECYRSYTVHTFRNELQQETVPEIQRSCMSSVVLQLKALGIDNLLQFEFIDAPSTASLERALATFTCWRNLNRMVGALTGRRMAEFPLDPSLSKCILRGSALWCLRHMSIAVAMLTLDSVFVVSRDPKERASMASARDVLFSAGNGDVMGYVRLMEEWMRARPSMHEFCQSHSVNAKALLPARDVLDHILHTCERLGLDLPSGRPGNIALYGSFLGGPYLMNVAKIECRPEDLSDCAPRDASVSRSGHNHNNYNALDAEETATAELHPSSYLFNAGLEKKDGKSNRNGSMVSTAPTLRERPELVVFTQLRYTSKRYMMHVTAISSVDWVLTTALKIISRGRSWKQSCGNARMISPKGCVQQKERGEDGRKHLRTRSLR